LLKRSLAGAWILVFVPAAQELSTAIFLVGPNTRVMSVLLLDLNDQGNLEGVAALGCTLLVVVIGVVTVGFRIVGRDFMLRRS
jgi:iron(III) transport system permease protein